MRNNQTQAPGINTSMIVLLEESPWSLFWITIPHLYCQPKLPYKFHHNIATQPVGPRPTVQTQQTSDFNRHTTSQQRDQSTHCLDQGPRQCANTTIIRLDQQLSCIYHNDIRSKFVGLAFDNHQHTSQHFLSTKRTQTIVFVTTDKHPHSSEY
jgi:hypothetical protein